jgi:hypothetical protein
MITFAGSMGPFRPYQGKQSASDYGKAAGTDIDANSHGS